MSNAANIDWHRAKAGRTSGLKTSRPLRSGRSTSRLTGRTAPRWLSFVLVSAMFIMLCVSINFRAFTEMRDEAAQSNALAEKITNLSDENLALQEEIHTIKTDPRVIAREAKRIGVNSHNEKISVSAN